MAYEQMDIIKRFCIQLVLDGPLRWGRAFARLGKLACARHVIITAEARTAEYVFGERQAGRRKVGLITAEARTAEFF